EDKKPAIENIDKASVVVSEKDHNFTLNVVSNDHYWLADQPVAAGGQNLGPDPYQHLLAALGTCTVMTLRMYAKLKKIPLTDISVTLKHHKNYHQDCQNCDQETQYSEMINRHITLVGELSKAQRQKLLSIADKCPVHKTLHHQVKVITTIQQ
ncbi:MAG: putative redox protein, partial [Psychromonas sp.]